MLRELSVPDETGALVKRAVTASELLDLMVAHEVKDRAAIEASGIPSRFVGRHTGKERGKFGNPFSHNPKSRAEFKVASVREAVEKFAVWIFEPAQVALLEQVRAELHGKVLRCFCQRWHQCGPGTPMCHAQVLVRIANPKLAAEAAREAQESKGAPTRLDCRTPLDFEAFRRQWGLEGRTVLMMTGDRNWRGTAAKAAMTKVLDSLKTPCVMIEGEARGADEMWRDLSLAYGYPVAGFPAQWDVTPTTPPDEIKVRADGKRYWRLAGFKRNEVMTECAPAQCIAFHDRLEDSAGTQDAARRAWLKGIPVTVVTSAGEVTHLGSGAPGDELPWQLREKRRPVATPGPSTADAVITEVSEVITNADELLGLMP